MTCSDPRGSLKRALICVLVCVAAVAALRLWAGPATRAKTGGFGNAASPFVTRSGDLLLLNGKPFRFSGTNIYWGGLDNNARTGLNYPTPFRVDSSLQTMADMGETVVRCQTCGISTGNPLSVEPYLGGFSQTALRHIDYFIAQAQRYRLKVVIPFTDSYGYYLGTYCDYTNWLHLSPPSGCPSARAASAFYDDRKAVAAFEKYISVLLNHVNYYTGVPNKDNPAILAWETGNELQFGAGGPAELSRWTARISAFIRSQDKKHLIMDGSFYPDSGNLKLPDVDIIDRHYYPLSARSLSQDAYRAAAAGKPMVAGEYAWNDASQLKTFLIEIRQTPSIAGDMYWDLQPQNDFFGYVEHYDGYQLHYPGDNSDVKDAAGDPPLATSSDVPEVTLLRLHAYAMSGRAIPAYPVPPPPVMTNVEHVASSTAGAGNLLEWRGSPGAAAYVVQRATKSASGPWTTVARVNAGRLQLPYLDGRDGTGPRPWYRVTAVNAAGAGGPASAPFQVTGQTLDDNLNSFAVSEAHAPGAGIDRSNARQFGGDPSRAAFPPGSETTAAWRVPGEIDAVEVIAYYGSINDMHFTFQVSDNDRTWQGLPASTIQAIQIGRSKRGDRIAFIYTLDNVQRILPGADHVRIVRHDGGTQAAEIGEVRITYR
jgi:mannan endo-1,4-beta-mannosidase